MGHLTCQPLDFDKNLILVFDRLWSVFVGSVVLMVKNAQNWDG